MKWMTAATEFLRDDIGFVLITVLETKGSAPRDANAKMVVSATQACDTIGGGRLELEAMHVAREMLSCGKRENVQREFRLGPELNQCCGGRVKLLLECFPATDFNIVLFGAGHVGCALVKILSELPCRVLWVDARADQFPSQLAPNIRTRVLQNADVDVERCPVSAYYLIMTHSHETDMELVEAILARGDSRYCGLIGSRTKGARFRQRLKRRGFTPQEIAQLRSPIGLSSVPGKVPMEVAVSVSAELIALHAKQNSTAKNTAADVTYGDVINIRSS